MFSNTNEIKSNFSLQILKYTRFHSVLIATCVEIVIYAYGTSNKFPWVLDCFKIDAFYFYKLIEVIVSNEEGILNRDLIKHLNSVSSQTHSYVFIELISHIFFYFN